MWPLVDVQATVHENVLPLFVSRRNCCDFVLKVLVDMAFRVVTLRTCAYIGEGLGGVFMVFDEAYTSAQAFHK